LEARRPRKTQPLATRLPTLRPRRVHKGAAVAIRWNKPFAARVDMAHLREKLEADPGKPELFITEPAIGYRLME